MVLSESEGFVGESVCAVLSESEGFVGERVWALQ